MGLSHDDVREILRIIDESDVDELLLETEGFTLHVHRGAGAGAPSGAALLPRATPEGTPPPAPAQAEASTAADPAPPQAPEASGGDGLVTIPSPMLGTFYRAEAPGAPPFVDVGAEVSPESTVCIIEVMKMMNSVPAGTAGVIEEICAENAQLVEYGEPLFRVRPSGR
jgi:acetyl-CoA carboxylase biotin carboxyl carrier protein